MRRLPLLLMLATLATIPVIARQDSVTCPDGQDQRCSDGKYHAPDGNVQPDTCEHMEGGMHECDCERSSTACDTRGDVSHPGAKCQTYCRPRACKCASPCDS